MRLAPMLVALAVAAGAGTAARTLTAEPPPAAGDEPLRMSADRLELDVEARTALLTGNVKLARGAVTLGCPRVDVRYDQVPHVVWAKGSGGVVAEVKGVRAEAPEVEVDLAAKTLELRGGVRLTRGEGWITAERATIHMATAKVTMSDVKGSIPLPKPP
jgi:lipopolysaccharide export system protein LptA